MSFVHLCITRFLHMMSMEDDKDLHVVYCVVCTGHCVTFFFRNTFRLSLCISSSYSFFIVFHFCGFYIRSFLFYQKSTDRHFILSILKFDFHRFNSHTHIAYSKEFILCEKLLSRHFERF